MFLRALRGPRNRGAIFVTMLLIATPSVSAGTPAALQEGQGVEMTILEALSGKTLPLTRKLSDLNGDWRRILIHRGPAELDAMSAGMGSVFGLQGAIAATPAYYTKGEVVRIEGKAYMVTYVWKPKPLTPEDFEKSRSSVLKPETKTPDSTLSLALINMESIRGMEDIRLFDLKAEIAGVSIESDSPFATARESAINASSLSNLKQIGLAAMMYTQDYDETFPPLKSPAETKKLLMPYIKNDAVFQHPDSQKPYLPNPFMSRKTMASLTSPASLIIYYEPDKAPDGTRAAVFADGHAKRLDEKQWRDAAKASHIPSPSATP